MGVLCGWIIFFQILWVDRSVDVDGVVVEGAVAVDVDVDVDVVVDVEDGSFGGRGKNSG